LRYFNPPGSPAPRAAADPGGGFSLGRFANAQIQSDAAIPLDCVPENIDLPDEGDKLSGSIQSARQVVGDQIHVLPQRRNVNYPGIHTRLQ